VLDPVTRLLAGTTQSHGRDGMHRAPDQILQFTLEGSGFDDTCWVRHLDQEVKIPPLSASPRAIDPNTRTVRAP
jgi:hypothetical protein